MMPKNWKSLSLPLRRWMLGILVTLVVAAAAATTYAFTYSTRVLPRTRVAGISIGGLTRTQAHEKVLTITSERLRQEVQVSYQLKTWQSSLTDLGIQADVARAVEQAYGAGREGSVVQQLLALAKAPFSSYEYAPSLSLGKPKETGSAAELQQALTRQPTETSLTFSESGATLIPGVAGTKIDELALLAAASKVVDGQASSLTVTATSFEPVIKTEDAALLRDQANTLLAAAWKLQLADVQLDLSTKQLASWLKSEVVSKEDGSKALRVQMDEPALSAWVSGLSGRVNQKAKNAQPVAKDGKIVAGIPSQPGRSLDVAATVTAISSLTSLTAVPEDRKITGVVSVVAPLVGDDAFSKAGVMELIGTATTDFAGSPQERRTNITVGTNAINGGIIMPGDTFSTIAALGPITEEVGYKTGLVIIGNSTEPGIGGGLCQVSTTLFRAVLAAGMPVVERVNHSYRVGYYEVGYGPGGDATIFLPGPDFKWKNNSDGPIYVESFVQGNKVTFNLYGTKDGRTAVVSPVKILSETPAPPDEYVNTDTLWVGEKVKSESAHPGARTELTYTVTKNGQTETQVFRSTYRPWPNRWLVGTKVRPESVATPEPTPTPPTP